METPIRFKGKVVVVTGAGSGIGRATSIKLAALEASLALSDINELSVKETATLCAQNHPKQSHIVEAFNVGSSEAVDRFIVSVLDQFGRIDHIFNCAGVNPTKMCLKSTSDDNWHKLVNTNLKGIFDITRACIPHLSAGASFLNVSSVAGVNMAMELGPKGIRTNVIAPGDIYTPTNCSVVAGHESLKHSASKVALGRLGHAGEVADVAIFWFSDASRYVNGSVVDINGGLE